MIVPIEALLLNLFMPYAYYICVPFQHTFGDGLGYMCLIPIFISLYLFLPAILPNHLPTLFQIGNGHAQTKRRRQIFTETLRWDIMLLLDISHSDGNDWQKLAYELGCSEHMIKVTVSSLTHV